jgi:hypothetical protein
MDSNFSVVGILMSATVSVITASIGLLLWADSRWVSAEDFSEFKEATHSEFSTVRKNDLQDKIFELSLVESPTKADLAMIQRYKSMLEDLNGE